MFKSTTIYSLAGQTPSIEALEEKLATARFVSGGASAQKSIGWIEPRGQAHGAMVESVNGQWLLRFMCETRQVPGTAIQAWVQEQCSQIESSTGRKPGKKERRDLKDDAISALLPRAFAREAATWVWIDPTKKRLVIDSTSASKCDDILTSLVKLLDGFCAEPVTTNTSPTVAMSTWLAEQEDPSPEFTIGKECELRACDESRSAVRYSNHTLHLDEIRTHITQGKQATRTAMNWEGRVSFVLHDSLQIKKIALSDDLIEQSKAQERADDFDGDAVLFTAQLSSMIDDLVQALGGQVSPGQQPATQQATGD